jgi:hypothetical protein
MLSRCSPRTVELLAGVGRPSAVAGLRMAANNIQLHSFTRNALEIQIASFLPRSGRAQAMKDSPHI